MKLRKLGGRYQPILESSADIFFILNVDAQHWSANCAPIDGLSCDADFLRFLDSDQNGKILPAEVRGSIQWLENSLSDGEGMWNESEEISLSSFRTDHDLGLALQKSAAYVLETLGDNGNVIRLDFIRARTKILQSGAMNGDGVIPPTAIVDPQDRKAVQDIISIMGGVTDLNGEQGIDTAQLTQFPVQAQLWLDWKHAEPRTSFPNPESTTKSIFDIQSALDHFFTTCMLLEQKEEGLGSEEPLLSNPNKEGILQWNVWIHPSFRDEWKHFSAIFPQRRALSWEEWERIWGEAECYMNWCMAEPEGAFSSISEERILALVADDTLREKITVQIEEDLASGALLSKLADLEKTLLYQRYIRSFLSSFVNFSHFYNPKRQSLPERGDLLMDGRLFRLSVQVLERERHKERAKDSGFFLLYIQVHTLNGDFEIATAVTGSRRGDLHVGKKGVFIQEDGVECPATVVDILNNPINIQEAFWAPFSSVQGFVQRRFESLSSKHQKELEATVEKNFSPADPSGKAALINGGVTVAALSSSFAYLIKTLSSIQLSHLFTMMLAPLLVVAFLSSFMAWWKLQNRDLGPILEASGWGINHPLYAPSWATRIFTQAAFVPKKERAQAPDLLIAYQSSVDPYGRSKAKIFLVFWIVLMVLFWYGFEYLVVLYEWSGLYQG